MRGDEAARKCPFGGGFGFGDEWEAQFYRECVEGWVGGEKFGRIFPGEDLLAEVEALKVERSRRFAASGSN